MGVLIARPKLGVRSFFGGFELFVLISYTWYIWVLEYY